MRRIMLKSKIHRAHVTDANLEYEGSISIDAQLCDAAQLIPFEKVDVYNCTNGSRFSTYVIPGNPGEITINGAAAWLARKGDQVILASYVDMDEEECKKHKPQLVYVDSKNRIQNVQNKRLSPKAHSLPTRIRNAS